MAAIAGIRAGTRSAKPGTGAGNLFGFLFVVVIVIALMFILYRQLYKNHSGLFAQAMVALLLMISQFVILMGDFYAPLMGSDGGTVLAVFLFLMGIIWIIGVGIVAIHQKNEQFQEKKIRKIYRSCRKNVISCKWHFFCIFCCRIVTECNAFCNISEILRIKYDKRKESL